MFLRLAQADWAEHRKFLAKNYSCRKKYYNPNDYLLLAMASKTTAKR